MSSEINWFPGHMQKALREIESRLKYVDIIFEVCDARIPLASRNPKLGELVESRPRIVLLNKSDLADQSHTRTWIAYFKNQGIEALPVNAMRKDDIFRIKRKAEEICAPVLEKAKEKGRIGRPVRAMVVGIPNSGKSTIINALCNRKVAITGDRPGVTRSFQWAKTGANMELMDMPGVLWPNLGSDQNRLVLALTGAIKTEVTDTVFVASQSLRLLSQLYPDNITSRYKIPAVKDPDDINEAYDRFLDAAKKRGCLLSGGRIDEERFALLLLDDFRSGRIGKMTLEQCAMEQEI